MCWNTDGLYKVRRNGERRLKLGRKRTAWADLQVGSDQQLLIPSTCPQLGSCTRKVVLKNARVGTETSRVCKIYVSASCRSFDDIK